MDRLSQILWRERELLDQLSFELELERLIAASGRIGQLVPEARRAEQVLSALRATELMRAVVADSTAEELGLAPNPSLAALAGAAPEPWREVLVEHRDALLTLTVGIADLCAERPAPLAADGRAT